MRTRFVFLGFCEELGIVFLMMETSFLGSSIKISSLKMNQMPLRE
jgi:hypothetical protein